MTPAQVGVLLLAVLEACSGAPLARAAPAPAPAPVAAPARGRVLHQMIADRLGDAAPASSEATRPPAPEDAADWPLEHADYDYYIYDYEDPVANIDDGDSEAPRTPAAGTAESSPAASDIESPKGLSSRPSDSLPAPEEADAGRMRDSDESGSSGVASENELSESTARTEVSTDATVEADVSSAAYSQMETSSSTEKPHQQGDDDVKADQEIDALISGVAKIQLGSNESTTSKPQTTLTTTSATVLFSSTISPSTEQPSTAAETPSKKPSQHSKSKPTKAGTSPDQLNEVPRGQSKVNEIDFEQQVSGSDKVLAYQLRAANLDPAARQEPQFFVPPIVRRPYRRRVPLAGGGRRSNAPSLGDRLAEQVRQQLARLQRQQATVLELKSDEQPAYRPPFVPTSPTTTGKPYEHPFVPTPPSTTSRPYKPPFVPTPPSTTSRPYKHPFVPTPPSTTSRPYKPPFVPTPPSTTSRPYKHPFVPVLPYATERPQPRRIDDGRGARPPATIVHQEKLVAGVIVGEYGEVQGGGTVRGVKYAADSSVDRRLLEAALAQFLRL